MGDARNTELVHATCVAVDGRGALLLGPSGSGKSDLALRTISGSIHDGGRRLEARLVADDQVHVLAREGRLYARSPAQIAGLIEVRGLGIISLPQAGETELRLAVSLVPPGDVARLPDPGPSLEILGHRLPLLRLAPFEASAPVKLALALVRLGERALPATGR